MRGQTLNMSSMDEEEQQTAVARFMESQQELERLSFERDELNTRAIRMLRSLLDAEQIRKVGGLPQPKSDDRFW